MTLAFMITTAGTGLTTAAVGVTAMFSNPVPNVAVPVKASTMPVPMAARLPKPPSPVRFPASRRSQQHHRGRRPITGHPPGPCQPSCWRQRRPTHCVEYGETGQSSRIQVDLGTSAYIHHDGYFRNFATSLTFNRPPATN